MYDLHVVGGGPAGCFAGIAAAQEGKKVLLSEEHKCIGKPEACSGLISKSGLDTLLPHINYKSVRLNTITSAKIISGKQHFTIRPKNEEAVLVSRSGLDSLSAAKFEQEGGKIELGKKVTRNFASSNIVGADGPASALAEYFGFPKILSFVACMQGNFAYSCESPHQTEIHLSSKDFPGFFGWAIPINNEEAKIGVGVSLPIHPLRHYRRFLSKLGVKGNPRNEFAAIIPTSTRSITGKKAGKYNVVLAGDAAGQVKATTGGGIFFSSQCGYLAGRFAHSPSEYEEKWRAAYGLDLSLHRHFRSCLDLFGGEPNELLMRAAKALLFEDLLSEKGQMDRLSQMLDPSILPSYAQIVARKISSYSGLS